jgi:hypothetical protein
MRIMLGWFDLGAFIIGAIAVKLVDCFWPPHWSSWQILIVAATGFAIAKCIEIVVLLHKNRRLNKRH